MKKSIKKLPEIHVWKNDSKRKYIFSYSSKIMGDNLNAFYTEGGSASVDNSIAKDKAVFEAVERYSGSKIPTSLKSDPYNKIQNQVSDPNSFIFFADDQYSKNDFPYKKYNSQDQIEWVEGLLLNNSSKILIPAFAVYLGYNQKLPSSGKYFPTASCGLAVHKTKKASIVNGILELIERNNAMKIWLNKLSAPVVDHSSISSSKLKLLLHNIEKEGLIAKVILSSQELQIPSFIGIIYSRNNNSPFMTIGLSAGADIEKTMQKSLEEALMVRSSLEYSKKTHGEIIFQKNQSQVKSFFDHCLYYAQSEKKKDWNFMIKGPPISIKQIRRKLPVTDLLLNPHDALLAILKKHGYDTYAVNLSSDIAKLMKLKCSKVIIPKLRQMEIDHNLCFFNYGNKIDRMRLKKSKPHPFA